MSTANNEEKTARPSAGRRERDTHAGAPGRKSGLATAMQAEIWHRRYPPTSVVQALATDFGHPLTAADMQTFTGLGITLAARGWSFIRECSGPQLLTFSYPPSDAGLAYLH
ncbi:hypothetical protein [Nocardia gipuzkoensis]|uniref:hypothetical protein n=1 Tax=Nocardia gipuzkoensis TaxID=2749991 RepID=UPI00237E076B|nr:hypothetical protein [Nocardia gipuzkoensis]MDE1675345.1 hypothetical protein [Nocardia gipuzkoensis]